MKTTKLVSLLLAVILLTGAFLVSAAAETIDVSALPADIYMATTGLDTNAGTEAAPVLSLNKALELVENGGTIHIVDSYKAPADFVWTNHGKDVTITGGTLDLSQTGVTQTIDGVECKVYSQGDGVTFDNMTLVLADTACYFANGHRLQVNENVTVSSKALYLYGGANGRAVSGTNVKLLGGSYEKIYGGGYKANVDGDVTLYVGNVNASYTVSHEGTKRLYGGGYSSKVYGNIDLTIAGANIDRIFGGNFSGSAGSTGNITVRMSGGATYSLYGGHYSATGTQTGNIDLTVTGGTIAQVFGANEKGSQKGNVTVNLIGGTITRRVFGGCYNEKETLGDFKSSYFVTGDVRVYLHEGVNFKWNSSESDLGLYAHSRYSPLFGEEKTYIYYVGTAAQTAQKNNLGSMNLGMTSVMGSASAADAIAVYDATPVKDWNIVLSDNIGANFRLDLPKAVADVSVLNVTVAGKTVSHDLSAYTPNAEGLYVVHTDVFASQMTENITLQLVVNGVKCTELHFTIREYAEAILNGAYGEKAQTLLKHTLNYGAAAQAYFKINTGNLANAGYELDYKAQLPDGFDTVGLSGQISGVKAVGATLVFKEKIALRYVYAAESLEGVTFTANGVEYTPKESTTQGQYYVDVPGINPDKYAENVTLYATKGEETMAIAYSPMHYIVRMTNKTESAQLKALLNAMCGYHESAVIYVANANVSVTLADVTGGKVTSNKTSYLPGQTVVLTITPDAGYDLVGLTVKKDGTNVEMGHISLAGGTYTFVAEEGNYTVECQFRRRVFNENAQWDLTDQHQETVTVNGVEALKGVASLPGGDDGAVAFYDRFTNIDLTIKAKENKTSPDANGGRTDILFEFENGKNVSFGIVKWTETAACLVETLGIGNDYNIVDGRKTTLYRPNEAETEAYLTDGIELRVVRSGTDVYVFLDGKHVAVFDLTQNNSGVTADMKATVSLRHYDAVTTQVDIPFTVADEITKVTIIDESVGGKVTADRNTYVVGSEVTLVAQTEGYILTGMKVDGKEIQAAANGTYKFIATKSQHTVEGIFKELIFAANYDTTIWDISGQYNGHVTVIGGAGGGKALQFTGAYQNVDLTLNARDYADSDTASRTEFGFEFDVDGDGKIDTSKGDQTVSFGIVGDKIQTRSLTMFGWKSFYDLSEAEKDQLTITEEEIAAGNEDGLDLRVIRYGTTVYLFIENRQVAICDLTRGLNGSTTDGSGITANTKMFIYLRRYDDAREEGVQIPFEISTDVAPVEILSQTENGTVSTTSAVNLWVDNVRTTTTSDTHFPGEKITLTAAAAGEEYLYIHTKLNGEAVTLTDSAYTFTATEDHYEIECVFRKKLFVDDADSVWDLSQQNLGTITVDGIEKTQGSVTLLGGGSKAVAFRDKYTAIDITVIAKENDTTGQKPGRTDILLEFDNGKNVSFGILQNDDGICRIRTLGINPNYIPASRHSPLYDLSEAEAEKYLNGGGVELRVLRNGINVYMFLDGKPVAVFDLSQNNSGVTADMAAKVSLRHYDAIADEIVMPFTVTNQLASVTITDTSSNGTVSADANNHRIGDAVTLSCVAADGYYLTALKVDGREVTLAEDGTYTFTAIKATYTVEGIFKELIFASNYDTTIWDISGQNNGHVTVIGGAGGGKALQFTGAYQNVDLTLNARDYTNSDTASRTEFGFEFDVDGDGKIDTSKGDQTVSFGIIENKIQTRSLTMFGWKSFYDLSEAEKDQLTITEEEIAAGNEDGLDLRVIRYGTTVYLFIENRQVAICDLTRGLNGSTTNGSGITANTKMFIYLRRYDDAREEGVQIPFEISTDVAPVEILSQTENGTVSTAGAVNLWVDNVRTTTTSDTHFPGEKITLTAAAASEEYLHIHTMLNGEAVTLTDGTYTFTATKTTYRVEGVFRKKLFVDNAEAVWDLSQQNLGTITVDGIEKTQGIATLLGGGTKAVAFRDKYTAIDITVAAKENDTTGSKPGRTDILFEFDNGKNVSFGILKDSNDGICRIRTLGINPNYIPASRHSALYVLNEAEAEKYLNGGGVELRVVRNGINVYMFLDGKPVAVFDLTQNNSGVTADMAAKVSLRHYDAIADEIVIPFTVTNQLASVTITDTSSNGTVSADANNHRIGDAVTLSCVAADGYYLTALKVDGREVTLAEDGTYTFTAIKATYTVEGIFKELIFASNYDTTIWDISGQGNGLVVLPNGGGATGTPLEFSKKFTDVDLSLTVRDYPNGDKAEDARTDVEFIFDNGETVTFGVVKTGGQYRIQNRAGTLLSWKTPYFITDQALIDAYVVTEEELESGNLGGLDFRIVRYGTEFYLYLNGTMVKGYDFSYKIAADTPVTVKLRHYDDAGFAVEIPFTVNDEVTVDDPRLFAEKEAVTDYAYSFAVLPDTQVVTANDAVNGEANLAKLFDWIVANKESKNIQFVFGLGDITDNNNEAEWTLAQTQFAKLTAAGIPYSAVRGNHDLPWFRRDGESATNYTTDDYTNYIGTEAYRAQFGGFYSETNVSNSWRTLQIGDVKYLLVTLDYGANDDVLNWASGVIYQHPDHNVIITTHAYLHRDGTTLDSGDNVPPSTSGGTNDGDDMWEKLVSKHENIVLVISGHDPSESIVVNRTPGDNGNTVTAMLIDAQDVEAQEGSMGMVAMLYFSADGKTVQVEYYSTAKEKYFMSENQFTLELDTVEAADKSTVPATGAYTTVALSEGSSYTATIDASQRITLPETPYTLSAWINLATSVTGRGGVILGNYKDNNTANCLNFEIKENGNPRVYHRNASNAWEEFVFTGVDIRSNTNWVHLAFAISGNQVSCYVNGELKQTLTATKTIQLESTTSDFVIGGDFRSGNGSYFKGKILHLDIYSGILSAEKILDLYVNGTEAVTEGKIEY